MRGAICYNVTNHIANGPALLQTAGTVSQDVGGVMTTPIVSPDSDNLKRCTKCGEWKPRTDFYRRKSKSDGLASECKQCAFEYRLLHRKVQYTVALPPETKICPRCGVLRPFSDFYKDRTQKDGLQTRCRDCKRVIQKQYLSDNADVVRQKAHEYNVSEHGRAVRRAYNAEYRRNNGQYYFEYMSVWRVENADHYRAYQKKYRVDHADQIAQYREQNRESINEKHRIYRKTESGQAAGRAHKANRRARIIANGGTVTAREVELIRKSQTDKRGRLICWRCRKPIVGTPHLDHFIPLDKGGPNTSGNLRFMHEKCNLNKSNKHPHELGMLI